ncbi:hypothetical protein ACQEU5_16145 [Marinactinospora thermotolerans]|nr:hypothetical protein [Marinactinospora thermotolerans]
MSGIVADRCWNDPALDAGVDAVREGHLRAGLVLLAETRGNPETRALRVDALGAAAVGLSREIHALLTRETPPQEAADILVWLGRTLIVEAWRIRGGGFADTVGTDRFKLFHRTLADARDPLLAAAELFPDDPVPWSCLQWVGLGLQFDRNDSDTIWQRVVERCPTLFSGHWARLQLLSEKWGGSHEEMMDFARATVANAPHGHPVVSMIALAHIERFLGRQRGLLKSKRYLAAMRQEVTYFNGRTLDEVAAAADKWCMSALPHPRDLEAHHLMGWVFHAGEEKVRARWHFYQVGHRLHRAPWSYTAGDEEGKRAFANALIELHLA